MIIEKVLGVGQIKIGFIKFLQPDSIKCLNLNVRRQHLTSVLPVSYGVLVEV